LNSSDVATFAVALSSGRTHAADDGRNIGGILFGCTNGWGFTLAGGPLLLSDGGVIQNAADTGAHDDVVSAPVVIQGDGGSAAFCANAWAPGCNLVFGGGVSGTASAGRTNTLVLTGTSTNAGLNVVSGVISDGAGGGRLALVKSGVTNTWLLSGANTFSGPVVIQQGTLVAANSGALGSAGSIALPAKTRLGLKGGVTLSGKALAIDGGATTATSDNGMLLNVDGTNVWTGDITMSGSTPRLNSDAGLLIVTGNVNMGSQLSNNFTLGGMGDGEIRGVISGSEVLFRSSSDTGTWYLTGTNTYSSTTTVGNGTIAINSDRSLGAARSTFAAAAVTIGGSSRRGTLRAIADVTLSDKYGVTVHNVGGFLAVDQGKTLTLNGVVTERTAGLSGPLTKLGAGTLVLNAANTFTNVLEVAEGRVVLGRFNALGGKGGNAAKLKVDATLDLGGFSATNPVLTGAGGSVTNGALCVTQETSPGGAGAIGQLNVPATTLQGVWAVDVEADGSSDRLNVVGGLRLDGLALSVADTGKLNQHQTYTLARCTGEISGRFSAHNLPENWAVDASGGSVQLKYFSGLVMSVR
jgi:autotransporter-associated beta strand protein